MIAINGKLLLRPYPAQGEEEETFISQQSIIASYALHFKTQSFKSKKKTQEKKATPNTRTNATTSANRSPPARQANQQASSIRSFIYKLIFLLSTSAAATQIIQITNSTRRTAVCSKQNGCRARKPCQLTESEATTAARRL